MGHAERIKKLRVLVLEDDTLIGRSIQRELEAIDVAFVQVTRNLGELTKAIEAQPFDLAYLDVFIGEKPLGLEALKLCNEYSIKAYMLSSSSDEGILKKGLGLSCISFLSKFKFKDQLVESIENYFRLTSPEANKLQEARYAK